jgi:hypothetical protein
MIEKGKKKKGVLDKAFFYGCHGIAQQGVYHNRSFIEEK